ncbi:MAG: chemotaxis protein CheW [Pseudomonadota bacterium]|nr:chemotaxis protein CheW [Pseudomonadota bacterium]
MSSAVFRYLSELQHQVAEIKLEEVHEENQQQGYVVFTVADYFFAVPAQIVLDIRSSMDEISVTQIPHAPAYVDGVMAYKNSPKVIVNLERLLWEKKEKHKTQLLIVNDLQAGVALKVDRVLGLRVSIHEPVPAPEVSFAEQCIQGLFQHDAPCYLLDLFTVMNAYESTKEKTA